MKKLITITALTTLVLFANYAYPQGNEIEDAYRNRSKTQLRDFFDTWHRSTASETPESVREYSRLIREAYSIFYSFYSPFSPDKEKSRTLVQEHGIKYVILQTDLRIYIFDQLIYPISRIPVTPEEIDSYILKVIGPKYGQKAYDLLVAEYRQNKRLTNPTRVEYLGYEFFSNDMRKLTLVYDMKNFMPYIGDTGLITLYLTEQYEKILNGFLGIDKMTGERHSTLSGKEIGKRLGFLQDHIFLLRGHWGNYWHLETQPHIDFMIIDPEYRGAIIRYRLNYGTYLATLRNEDGKWTLCLNAMSHME